MFGLGTLLDGMLRAIALFHPEAKPLIDAAIKHEPELEKLVPIVSAALKEGKSAYDAAVVASPELAKAIHDYASSLPATASSQEEATHKLHAQKEVITKMLTGQEFLGDASREGSG